MSTRELQFFFTALVVAALGAAALLAIDWSPVNFGQINFYSMAGDREIGVESAAAFGNANPIITARSPTAYVQDLGTRLGAVSDEPGVDYQFMIVDNEEINACAFPGGFIFVNRGLLETIQTEAELAAVLGHEIGHVVARHGSESLSRAQLVDFLDALRGSIHFSNGLYSGPVKPFRTFSAFVSGLERRSFSRGHEREADALGLEYMIRAQYDAAGMAAFHGRMAAMHADQPLARWLSTHPLSADRVAYVRKIIRTLPPHAARPPSAAFQQMQRDLRGLPRKPGRSTRI
jgi:predicted Zn-dependent protease